MSVFAPERPAPPLAECHFYHSMELPGIGLVEGEWDLRSGVEEYLGGVDVAGKRVLDVGTASGFLAFEMERRGAEVVGFDLAEDEDWDVVPYGGAPDAEYLARRRGLLRRLQNSWWLSRALYGAKARVAYGSVYAPSEDLGRFDVALFGSILLHLRDPFRALEKVARITDETLIVTDVIPGGFAAGEGFVPPPDGPIPPATSPVLHFLPDPARGEPRESWWSLSPAAVCRMLEVLGLGPAMVRHHAQRHRGGRAWLFTAVARRKR